MSTSRKPKPAPPKTPFWHGVTRDLVMFSVGLVLFVLETQRAGAPRSEFIMAYLGMMGLPTVIFADRVRRRRNGDE